MTADKTNGIAGNDINWIKVNPKSFKGSDKEGINLPIKIEIGIMTSRNSFGFLKEVSIFFIEEYVILKIVT